MNIQDAQKIFRQQLTLASQQLTWCLNSNTRIEHLSALQGSILCLHLGLSAYIGALFNLDNKQVFLSISKQDMDSVENYRQEEIISLIDNSESWLAKFNDLAVSMGTLPHRPKTTTNDENKNLIASSVSIQPQKFKDWRTEKDSMSEYIESAKELLERHISSDVEY